MENVNLGERRPTALVRKYGNLYAQARVDTLDALDALPDLKNAEELKSKLLFSVVVVSVLSSVGVVLHVKVLLCCYPGVLVLSVFMLVHQPFPCPLFHLNITVIKINGSLYFFYQITIKITCFMIIVLYTLIRFRGECSALKRS